MRVFHLDESHLGEKLSLKKRYLTGHQMFAKYSKNFSSTSKKILAKNFNSES